MEWGTDELDRGELGRVSSPLFLERTNKGDSELMVFGVLGGDRALQIAGEEYELDDEQALA